MATVGEVVEERSNLQYHHQSSIVNERHQISSTPSYFAAGTPSTSYIQPQMETVNSVSPTANYHGTNDMAPTNQYQTQSSPDHLPPTPYSYGPSTPCPQQNICLANLGGMDASQGVIDSQGLFVSESNNQKSETFPPTPYSSDPPTNYLPELHHSEKVIVDLFFWDQILLLSTFQ